MLLSMIPTEYEMLSSPLNFLKMGKWSQASRNALTLQTLFQEKTKIALKNSPSQKRT